MRKINFQLIGMIAAFLFFTGESCLLEAKTLPQFSSVEVPAKKFFVGEKMTYQISYFAIPFGRVETEVKDMVEVEGRLAYHIALKVTSSTLVDIVHKVRGEHHSYVDAETLQSIRYAIPSSKNPGKNVFQMTFNPAKERVYYDYLRKDIHHNFPFLPLSQDRLSLGFFFRTMTVGPGETVEIPLHTEEKSWKVQIKTLETKSMEIPSVGRFQAMKIEPKLDFVIALSKPGSVDAWVSLDERRIPLLLSAKAPLVGRLKVALIKYEPGKSQ